MSYRAPLFAIAAAGIVLIPVHVRAHNCNGMKGADYTQCIEKANSAAITEEVQDPHAHHGMKAKSVPNTVTGTGLPAGDTTTKPTPGHQPEQIPEEQLLSDIDAKAEQLASDPQNKWFRPIILQSAAEVKAKIKSDPETAYGAEQVGAFGLMADNQITRTRGEWELGKRLRRREIKQKEYDSGMEKLKTQSDNGMNDAPQGIIMNIFHPAFDKALAEKRAESNDPTIPASGRPSRRHIDFMLDTDPKNPSTLTLSAQDKLAGGDRAGGLMALNAAIANGGTADAYALRGGMRLENQDYNGAYTDAAKSLELNPGDKNAMGILKSAEGRASPEVVATGAGGGSGSADDGGSGSGRSGGGSGFVGLGSGSGSLSVAGMTSASALASNQKLDEARRALALGDFQAAIALAQRALELNPRNAAAHNLLSMIYARKGDYKRAIASASAGLEIAPRDGALLNSKAFAENRAKLYRDALASSNGAIEADSRNALSFANRGHAYGGLGDKESMMSDLNRAAGLDPRYKKAAEDAASLQLPSNADILFLFPGENPSDSSDGEPARGRSFGFVVGAGILGGLMLAFGLLSTVLAPLKESVASAFTKATRRGPSVSAMADEDEVREPAPAAASAAGLIRGQYEISRQIGMGGMGMVYEGTDRSLGRRVAIKKMRDELRLNARERDRFIIEAKTVASLHHPGIVDIYAIAEEGEDVYLVFEYVDGKTVHDLIQSSGRLSVPDAVKVTRAMGEALTYAHAHGVIHRDMKPSNVMLTDSGQVKVMDFGIARMAKDALTRYSMTNTVVGTPPYMAPEQEQGVVRKESDVYALAICAYEMLTGKLPFIGMGAGMLMNKINMNYIPPSRSIAGLPESLDGVFVKAFQADPERRYRTPLEFSAALDSALGGTRSSAKPS